MSAPRSRPRDCFRPVADVDSRLQAAAFRAVENTVIINFPPALASIEVVGDRGLRIIVQELPAYGAPADDRYELEWEVVVGFLVRGDPFPKGGPSVETLSDAGNDTSFLKMLRSESHVEADYIAAMHAARAPTSEIRHWRVSTTEALIDIAATYGPTVRRLSRHVR
jgi:hypothetical protein